MNGGSDTLATSEDPFAHIAGLFSGMDGFLIAQCAGILIATSIAWTMIAQVTYRMTSRGGALPVSTAAVTVSLFTAILFAILAVHPSSPVTGSDTVSFGITTFGSLVPSACWWVWANRRAKQIEECG